MISRSLGRTPGKTRPLPRCPYPGLTSRLHLLHKLYRFIELPAKTDRYIYRGSLAVGLDASAGGLEAFTQFFTHMPGDSGLAFVLASHLDPDDESLMAGCGAALLPSRWRRPGTGCGSKG
jgi:chemotaxis response regulator CheB